MQGDFLATEELSHRGLGSKETENETFSTVAESLKTTIGTLSNDDGSERENVTQKVNSRCFKRHCSYSSSFNLLKVGYFFSVVEF